MKDRKNQSENENLAKWVVSIPLNSSISKFGSRGSAWPAIEYGTSNAKRVSTSPGYNSRKIITW